jgi:hypothetical protein
VRQHAVPAVERLECEADPVAAFAELLGDEAGERNSGLAQELPEPARDRRLPDPGPALAQNEQQALRHGRAPYEA